MNKKFIRNIILLLLIPIIITLIIYKLNIKKVPFEPIVSYNNRNTVNSVNSINTLDTKNTNKDELNYGTNIFDSLNGNYTYIMFFTIGFTLLFFVFYYYLSRKKGW